jgi:hypothetical protein
VRRALSRIGVLQIISGNLGLVRTEILRSIGGFREVWGEDLEVTLRLKRNGVRVVYGASTRVLAECPGTPRALWRQRVRWLRSYIKIIGLHRDLVGNPRYRLFGPFLAFNVINMVMIPVAQVLALLLLPIAWQHGKFYLHGFEWIAYLGLGFLLVASVVAILLDKTPRDLMYLPYAALLLFFSHFYNAIVLYSIWAELFAREELWNKLERREMRAKDMEHDKQRRWFLNALVTLTGTALGTRYLGWLPEAQGGEGPSAPTARLAQQAGTTAVAIHFDAWTNWRDAYENLLAMPEARYVNRVAVSAGRADWTYFRWQGNESWWSPEQVAADTDMLEHTLAVLHKRGYRTTAIFDVFGERYLKRYPDAAAVDVDGKSSKIIICSTELADGAPGNHLASAIDALAASTQADAVAVTELFYDKHCYDHRCLMSYKQATGRRDWPRNAHGKIDYLDSSIGTWRSRQVESIAARLAQYVHAHGKKFALDVKVSHGDVIHSPVESGQDYRLLAPHVDEFVVWDYFALAGEPPENAARVAAYFADEFGADKFYLSIGLWDRSGVISGEVFARALQSAQEGGASKLWITPGELMTVPHWRTLAEAVRNANNAVGKS